MALSEVQVKFVNEVVRPMIERVILFRSQLDAFVLDKIERVILFRSQLDAFVLDFDNQQTPVPTNATVMDDNSSGTAPRTDAPQLTGAQITSLRNFCAGMRDQIS